MKLEDYRGIIKKDLNKIEAKIDTLQTTIDLLNSKLEKHINFIDDTYEGLKNPLKAASRFFKR